MITEWSLGGGSHCTYSVQSTLYPILDRGMCSLHLNSRCFMCPRFNLLIVVFLRCWFFLLLWSWCTTQREHGAGRRNLRSQSHLSYRRPRVGMWPVLLFGKPRHTTHSLWTKLYICCISGEAAGEIWNWSVLGVKGLAKSPRVCPLTNGFTASALGVCDPVRCV